MFNSVLKNFSRIKPISAALKTKKMSLAMPATQAAFSAKTDNKYAPWEQSKILLTGCQGQIGVPLVHALC